MQHAKYFSRSTIMAPDKRQSAVTDVVPLAPGKIARSAAALDLLSPSGATTSRSGSIALTGHVLHRLL